MYFGGQGIGNQLAVIIARAATGAVVAILASRFHDRRALAVEYPDAGRGAAQPAGVEQGVARA